MHPVIKEIQQIWGGESYDFNLDQSGKFSTTQGLVKQIENLGPDDNYIFAAIPLSNNTTHIKGFKIK